MFIRNYKNEDEKNWLKCRLLAFYNCSYYDDVLHEKEAYKEGDINLVMIEDKDIIGFIDIELQKSIDEMSSQAGDLIAVINNVGVLEEYQGQGIASQLLNKALNALKYKGVQRLQAWTQDDTKANDWYLKHGFEMKEAYLNVYGSIALPKKALGEIFSVRSINFEAPLYRKDELSKKFKRIHEVRLYEKQL